MQLTIDEKHIALVLVTAVIAYSLYWYIGFSLERQASAFQVRHDVTTTQRVNDLQQSVERNTQNVQALLLPFCAQYPQACQIITSNQ